MDESQKERAPAPQEAMRVPDLSAPCREKSWAELTDAEKIERLRMVVKRQEVRIEELENLGIQFLLHGHVAGQVMRPVESSGLAFPGVVDRRRHVAASADVWF